MQKQSSKFRIVRLLRFLVCCEFIAISHGSSYATLNLNEWLTEFDDCNVYISNLDEDIWDGGRFEYPVILTRDKNYTEISNPRCQYMSSQINTETEQICFQTDSQPELLQKNIFGTANIILLPSEFSTVASVKMISILQSIPPTCSKSVFLSSELPFQYKWTTCMIVFVVHENGKIIENRDISALTMLFTSYSGTHDIEYFVFTYRSRKLPTQQSYQKYSAENCVLRGSISNSQCGKYVFEKFLKK